VGKPEGKRPLRIPRHKWEDNIKMDLQEGNLSTSHMLTMEYVEGGQVNDLAYIRSNDIDHHEVSCIHR